MLVKYVIGNHEFLVGTIYIFDNSKTYFSITKNDSQNHKNDLANVRITD
jgi:hypothetical protein